MRTTRNGLSAWALSMLLIGGAQGLPAVSIEGALKARHPVTLAFTGKEASETEASTLDVYDHPIVSHSFHPLESRQSGTFAVQWWRPRKNDGGRLQDGSITRIPGGDVRSLGHPPSDPGSSWAALVLSTESWAEKPARLQ
jgi:hypothetical protein